MRTFHVDPELLPQGTPLIVADFNVLCWDIFNAMGHYNHNYSSTQLDTVLKALWAIKLNRGPEFFAPHFYRIVVVDDAPPYWRETMIKNDPQIHNLWLAYENKLPHSKRKKSLYKKTYKGNRPPKPDLFHIVRKAGIYYASKYLIYIKIKSYEADDIAGAIVRLCNLAKGGYPAYANRQTYLWTIDRDWSGLVSDRSKIYWVNTRKPGLKEIIQNVVAKEIHVIEHTAYKLKRNINKPSELYNVKHELGDESDNLPPGTPIEYIDLINAHHVYNIDRNPTWLTCMHKILATKQNVQISHYNKSIKFLKKLGFHISDKENTLEPSS